MKPAIGLSIVLLIGGCTEYAETGKHVPIDGFESQEQKVAIAKRVLVALPVQQVREQVRQRYPQLTSRDLERVNLDYAVMQFVETSGTSRQEVHLIVTVWENKKFYSIASELEEFVASLLRAELARQGVAPPINLMQPTATRSAAGGG